MTRNQTLRAAVALAAMLFCTIAVGQTSPSTAVAGPDKRVDRASAVPYKRGAQPPKKTNKKTTLSGKLNINTATEQQLMMLPGVGPKKAERIVDYRKKRKFARVRDLRRVKGFGYKTVKKLEPYLQVKGPNTLRSQ